MGFNLEDWASIVGLVTACLGGIAWLVKVWIITPLSGEIKKLNKNFDTLNGALDKSRSDFKLLEDRVDSHDVRLTEHTEQIKTLFKERISE